jgi:hypothetical protein
MADPVQRGTAALTFPAPTSTVFKINGGTFKLTPTADLERERDEANAEDLDVISNPGHQVSFTGRVKAGQTPVKVGDVLILTYPAGHQYAGAKEYVVDAAPQEGFGRVIKQNVEAHLNDAADYTP